MMSEKRTVRIDLDKLKSIASRGVHRAAVFMGLAANIARLDPPPSHVLDDKFRIVLVPDKVSDETKRHFLEEFEKSVVANGLRELVDTFQFFLTEAHRVASFSHEATTGKPFSEDPKPARAFELENVGVQLDRLAVIVGTKFTLATMFESLVTARNVLTHNRGIVRARDCPQGSKAFELRWNRMHTWIAGRDGRVLVELAPGSTEGFGVALPEEGQVHGRLEDTKKSFEVGTVVEINRHELAEICEAVQRGADEVIKALLDYLKSIGVPQEDRPKPVTGSPPTNVDGLGDDDAGAASAGGE